MAYRVLLSKGAQRAIEAGLPESVAAAVWEFLSGPLAENPHRVGRQLRGDLAGYWSARRGEYRVVYSVEDETVTVVVVRIAHRRSVYR